MAEENIPRATSEFGSWQKPVRRVDDVKIGRTTPKSWKSFCKVSPTEEQSAAVKDELVDVTTCCICDETYRDPVILPCVHTYCLTCLQHIGTYTNKNPGDPMPCPLCRQEFTIPEDGFTALKRNFFMVRFIEITTKQRVSSGCDMHENESLRLYCSDCNEVLCLVCLIDFHENHRVTGLSSAADILRSQLQSNVSTAKQCMSVALKKKDMLLQQKLSVLEKTQGIETEVNQIRRDLKVLIDRQADSLLENLDVLKNDRIEDIEFEENELDKHLDCLKDFEMCCAELASNDGHDSLFCKMASEMNEQVVELELLNKSLVEHQLRSVEINFTKTVPTALELYKTKNIIGVVKGRTDYREKPELVRTIGTVTEGDTISSMTVSDYNDVLIAYENNPVVSIYDSYMHKCMTKVTIKGAVGELNLRHCVIVAGNIYFVNGKSREILRIDPNRDFMKWSTKHDWGRLSVSAESTLVATCYLKTALKEYSLQGTLLRKIKLCSTIVHPLHAVKLGNGNFVVSHGSFKDSVNRVCMVNDAGGIIKSFGDKRGSSIQQLDCPICLGVDESGNILVLDRNNSRVLLLSPALEFKMVLLTKANGLRRPVAIHLDEKNGQLYIADNNWEQFKWSDSKVFVFSVK